MNNIFDGLANLMMDLDKMRKLNRFYKIYYPNMKFSSAWGSTFRLHPFDVDIFFDSKRNLRIR